MDRSGADSQSCLLPNTYSMIATRSAAIPDLMTMDRDLEDRL